MSAAAARRAVTRPRPIDVYKKLQVLRTTDDTIMDETGSAVSVTSDDLSRELTAPVKTQTRLNIPIAPVLPEVSDYEAATKGGFVPPVAYIRLVKRSEEQALDLLEYVLEHCDEVWLSKRGHGANLLDADKLERALDLLEKATGMGTPITQDAAEGVLTAKLGMVATSASREVVADVYQYWLAKRNALQKPLLRRFQPPTAPDDTNPHNVFRPREKERYKLRKHRKNDFESFRKMQLLRRELDRVRVLLDLVRHRERLKRLAVAVGADVFEEQAHSLLQGGGHPHTSAVVEASSSSGLFVPSVDQPSYEAAFASMPSLVEDDGLARARDKRLAALASGANAGVGGSGEGSADRDGSDNFLDEKNAGLGEASSPKGDGMGGGGSGCGAGCAAGGGGGGGAGSQKGVFVEDLPTFLESSSLRHTPLPWVRFGAGLERRSREPRLAVYDGSNLEALARAKGLSSASSSSSSSSEGFLFERLAAENEAMSATAIGVDALSAAPMDAVLAAHPLAGAADAAAVLAAEVKQGSSSSSSRRVAAVLAQDPTAPITYSCRGRIGRGGRIIFDRIPTGVISSSSSSPTSSSCGVEGERAHVTFGAGLGRRPRSSVADDACGAGIGSRAAATTPRGSRKRSRTAVQAALKVVYNGSDSEDEELKQPGGGSQQRGLLANGVSLKYEIAV